jgi:hypothetical protein
MGFDPQIFRSGGTAVGGIDRALRQWLGMWPESLTQPDGVPDLGYIKEFPFRKVMVMWGKMYVRGRATIVSKSDVGNSGV